MFTKHNKLLKKKKNSYLKYKVRSFKNSFLQMGRFNSFRKKTSLYYYSLNIYYS